MLRSLVVRTRQKRLGTIKISLGLSVTLITAGCPQGAAQVDVRKPPALPSAAAVVAAQTSAPELLRRPCATEPCPVHLRVAGPHGAPIDLTLAWPLPGPIAAQPASDRPADAGLACPSPPRVWSIGSEDKAATVAACEVRLGAGGTPAWLVATEAGFEHVKRRFDLFAGAGSDGPTWSAEDGAGPTLSSVIVRHRDKTDEIVRFQVTTPVPGKPDVVETHVVSWNAGSGKFEAAAGGVPAPGLVGVVVASFASAAAARQARAKAAGCLDDLWVVRAADVERAKSGVVLAMPIADAAKAKLSQAALQACAPDRKIRTVPWPEKRR